jgi:hypothetical protein
LLTSDEIQFLLGLLSHETVVPESKEFPYRVVNPRGFGYSKDPKVGQLQAKLSIMLQVAGEAGR